MLFCVIMGRVRSRGTPLLCNFCVIIHSNVTVDNSRAKVFHHSNELKGHKYSGFKDKGKKLMASSNSNNYCFKHEKNCTENGFKSNFTSNIRFSKTRKHNIQLIFTSLTYN